MCVMCVCVHVSLARIKKIDFLLHIYHPSFIKGEGERLSFSIFPFCTVGYK